MVPFDVTESVYVEERPGLFEDAQNACFVLVVEVATVADKDVDCA